MTKKQFLMALDALELSKNGAPDVLGISRSGLYRICNGSAPVPESVAKLLDMYLRHGIPD